MAHKFAELAFTPAVRELQAVLGSRDGYAGMDEGDDYNHLLSEREVDFIRARDSFYMASVSETGWPYLQHRGGPIGFLKVLDATTIGFADYSGNRQYISAGNFKNETRIALFLMDYPNRTRLKILGRVQVVSLDDQATLARLEDDHYRARIERAFIIHIEAFDWNCPQHITPRFSESEVEALISPLAEENQRLKSAQIRDERPSPEVLGEGELTLVVCGIRQLTPRVRAFELRHPEGLDLPAVTAGSHLAVPVQLADGEQVIRHYSIASNPERHDIYEIAVLREEQGSGGSRAVQESYRLGTTIRTALPSNSFTLHKENCPAILIAGGIGITSLKAMAQTLTQRGISMHLHYAGRSENDMAYCGRLRREFGESMTVYAGDKGKRLDITTLLRAAPDNAVFYVCGPARLIDAVIGAAEKQGINASRVRFERFAAGYAADAQPVQVELRRSGISLTVKPQQTILDAMLNAGIKAAYSCKTGVCKSCAVRVIEGEPDHRDTALSDDERHEQQLMCPCVSRAKTNNLVLDS